MNMPPVGELVFTAICIVGFVESVAAVVIGMRQVERDYPPYDEALLVATAGFCVFPILSLAVGTVALVVVLRAERKMRR